MDTEPFGLGASSKGFVKTNSSGVEMETVKARSSSYKIVMR